MAAPRAGRLPAASAELLGLDPNGQYSLLMPSGSSIALPVELVCALREAAELMADGASIQVSAKEALLTTGQVAARLGVSRQYVARLLDMGQLPSVRVGSHRRVRAVDVEAYRAERQIGRRAALDRLVAYSEEINGYAAPE